MTNKEKLAEIENCVSTRSGDIEWLIERIKTLTAALQDTRAMTRLDPAYEPELRAIVPLVSAVFIIADKALTEGES